MTVHLFLFISIMLLKTEASHGQRHIFNSETFSDQFPQSKINKIYHGQGGYFWLGTSIGLMSFDGINYDIIAESNGYDVTSIYALSDEELLLGAADGRLLKININDRIAKTIVNDSIGSKITGIVLLQDQIFVASYGDGLWKYQNDIWERLTDISDFSIDEIYDMTVDEKGRILLGTDDGLCIIDKLNEQCKLLTTAHGLPDNVVTSIRLDSKDWIWLGLHQSGICALKNDVAIESTIIENWNFGTVTSLNVELEEHVFVGTNKGVVLDWDILAEKHEIFIKSEKSRNGIYDILVDRESNLWIADQQNGLSRSSLLLSFIDLPHSIKSKNIQAISMDEDDRLWFTTEKALWVYDVSDDDIPKFIKHLDAEVYGSTYISLYADAGVIWIGTFGDGLLYYHPASGKIQLFKERHGLTNNNILSIAGTDETIWFATLGGVSELNKQDFRNSKGNEIEFKNYHQEDGLGTEYIYQVYTDSNDNPWFATDGKGLTVLRDGKFINYSEKDGLESNVIYSITEDENEIIWLATPKDGLYKFDGNAFELITTETGFSQKQISSLHACNNSLFIIHKFGIDIMANDQIRNFGIQDNIGEIDPDLNAITEDRHGNIWLGYQEGIIKLNTNFQLKYQPDMLINRVLVNLNPLENHENNILSYNENYLTFNYIGFWYSDPLKIRYEYKLEGLNEQWIASRDNFVTFSNLPAGKYNFSVRASINEDFSSAKEASFQFSIKAPYWETLWFYAVLITLIVFFVMMIIVLRDRSLKKKVLIEQEKIQFQFETLKSQINPHFLFNSFNTLISIIEEEPKIAIAYVEKLSDFFRHIIQLREKDVISLSEEINLIKDYAFLQEKRYGRNFSLSIDIPEQYLDTEIPPMTIQLLAENAIKHNVVSKSRPLLLRVFVEQNYVVVQNDIQLKNKSEVSTNYGLENIIKRYQLLTDISVEVIADEKLFTIRLPIIYL